MSRFDSLNRNSSWRDTAKGAFFIVGSLGGLCLLMWCVLVVGEVTITKLNIWQHQQYIEAGMEGEK